MQHMDNATIASKLDAFAALLELAAASPYSVRAYRRAAELVRGTPLDVAALVREGRARELRGIGPGIERRLDELVTTGRIAELDELERELAPELVAVGRYLGLGPRRLLGIGRALGVRTLDELKAATAAGRLRDVQGVGPETERRVVAALERGPPVLVTLCDVRGDLHAHTTWSDGRATVLEMGRAARDLGYEYLAICDHTPAVGAVPGLTADDV